MIRILREFNNVVIPGGHWTGNTFHRNHAAGPSLVRIGNKVHMYFRGVQQEHTSQIGVYTFNPYDQLVFDGHSWDNKNEDINPIIVPGDTGFDSKACRAPCATVMPVHDDVTGEDVNTVFLYYMGVYPDSENQDEDLTRMMLVKSTDGRHFGAKTPIYGLPFHTPSVIAVAGTIYMVGGKNVGSDDDPQYRLRLWKSTDQTGVNFAGVKDPIVPLGNTGEWDSYSITGIRLFYSAPYMYAIYCASSSFKDYNEGIGLARVNMGDPPTITSNSQWEKYSGNPIMLRGAGGMHDEGGLWSPCFFMHNGQIHVFYEGVGEGAYLPGNQHSILVRDVSYGGYWQSGASTQYSYSSILHGRVNINDLNAEWSKPHISGSVHVKNVGTGKYLNMADTSAGAATLKGEPETLSLSIKGSGDAFARFQEPDHHRYLKIYGDSGERKVWRNLVSGTLTDDRMCDFLLYQVDNNIYKIQNRHSGLFLCPYANGGEGDYVGQALDNGTNMTLWEITNV